MQAKNIIAIHQAAIDGKLDFLSGVQVSILIRLAIFENMDTGLICPKQKTIAKATGFKLRAVGLAIRALEKFGLVERRAMNAKLGRLTSYTLKLDSILETDQSAPDAHCNVHKTHVTEAHQTHIISKEDINKEDINKETSKGITITPKGNKHEVRIISKEGDYASSAIVLADAPLAEQVAAVINSTEKKVGDHTCSVCGHDKQQALKFRGGEWKCGNQVGCDGRLIAQDAERQKRTAENNLQTFREAELAAAEMPF